MTTTTNTIRRGALLGALATPMTALGACGSATTASQSTRTPGAAPLTASQSGGRARTVREAVIRQCTNAANGDPASASLSLAHHGITVETTGGHLSCMSSANDRAGATACLARYAR